MPTRLPIGGGGGWRSNHLQKLFLRQTAPIAVDCQPWSVAARSAASNGHLAAAAGAGGGRAGGRMQKARKEGRSQAPSITNVLNITFKGNQGVIKPQRRPFHAPAGEACRVAAGRTGELFQRCGGCKRVIATPNAQWKRHKPARLPFWPGAGNASVSAQAAWTPARPYP